MKFLVALTELKNGKELKRRNKPSCSYILYNGIIHARTYAEHRDNIYLSLEDVLADDWEVVKTSTRYLKNIPKTSFPIINCKCVIQYKE